MFERVKLILAMLMTVSFVLAWALLIVLLFESLLRYNGWI